MFRCFRVTGRALKAPLHPQKQPIFHRIEESIRQKSTKDDDCCHCPQKVCKGNPPCPAKKVGKVKYTYLKQQPHVSPCDPAPKKSLAPYLWVAFGGLVAWFWYVSDSDKKPKYGDNDGKCD